MDSWYPTDVYIEAGSGYNIHYIIILLMKLISYFSAGF